MLLFVTGASGSGKTAVIPGLRKRFPVFDVHDFDERDGPAAEETRWRQEQTEYWISVAITNQRLGKDTIVCGGAVFGEILACPSIHQIDHLAVCLLDCADIVRVDRMRRVRGTEPDMSVLAWSAWLRVHAVDPTWHPEVIRENGYDLMRWDNWSAWERDDPRWQVAVIDTGGKKVEQITSAVARWIEAQINAKDQSTSSPLPPPQPDDILREEGN
ncbi:MAG: hypothetical protein KDI19_08055 [Pseudomonadales bacterium]|nr:hypothetical protein [Pseudomonadales bacterium]